MLYYTTRAFPTASRQYEAGDAIDPASITAAEWIRGTESGAVVPARWYGTAAELAARGIPGPGIQVYEVDTRVARVGDGITSVASLPQVGMDTYASIVRLNVKAQFGAKGDGITDDSAAFLAALHAAKAAARSLPAFLSYIDKVGGVAIEVPAGDYLITTTGGLLGAEALATKVAGIKFVGAGYDISNIIFKPASADALCTNDYWQQVQFQDLGFYAGTAGCTLFAPNATHSGQGYKFVNCYFCKWKYLATPLGTDNNSEWLFLNCHSRNMEDAGAWAYIPAVGASDQFVNWWFYGCSHWSTSAPIIDFAAGGGVHIHGMDVSDWGVNLIAPGYLFNLRGNAHGSGTCGFSAKGLRWEGKNNNAAILYSEWNQGNVSIRDLDAGPLSGTYTYGDVIWIKYGGVDGSIYNFTDSVIPGGVKVGWGVGDWGNSHRITFRDCTWLQRDTPDAVVNYDASAAGGNNQNPPPVKFINCRPATGLSDVTSGTGAMVWDATMGYRGELVQTLQERWLSVRGVWGVAVDGVTLTATVPVGALITGLRTMAPAASTPDGTTGVWTLATTEGSPATIATVSSGGALSAGYDVTTSLAQPFISSTAAKAKMTLTCTGVTTYNPSGLVMIRGLW